MNPRERTIAMAVLSAIILAVGGVFFQQLYLVPLHEREESVRAARDARDSQRRELQQAAGQQAKLVEWRKLSLPSGDNIAFCQREYRELLNQLITSSGFPPGELEIRASDPPPRSTGGLGNTETFYTPLNFTVSGRADLSRLVRLLQQFYSQPLLHKIKSLQIRRPTGSTPKTGELEIDLKVEAIMVRGAKNRSTLLPAEKDKVPPHVLAEPPREYADIAEKNIFYAPVPPPKHQEGPDPAASVKLLGITLKDGEHQVLLHDETAKPPISWWLYPEKKKDIFEIRNKSHDLRVQGVIVRVNDQQDVIFRSGERYYRISLGQTLEAALRKPLTAPEVKALKLPPASDVSPTR